MHPAHPLIQARGAAVGTRGRAGDLGGGEVLAGTGDVLRRSQRRAVYCSGPCRAPDQGRLLGVELAEHGVEHRVVHAAAVADAEQLGPLLPDHPAAQPGLGLAGGLVVARTQRAEALPAAVDASARLLLDGPHHRRVGVRGPTR